MLWIISIIIIAAMYAVIILFMCGTTRGRPEWYQHELDDEQMKAVCKMKLKKCYSENQNEEKD